MYHNITSTMTESNIFEILLNSDNSGLINSNINYPKLHSKTVELIADKFTKIIYDTVKNKSISSTTKRLNILKFLQNLSCNSRNDHLSINEKNYGIFLQFIDDKRGKFDEFPIETVIEEREVTVCDTIIEFNRRKNETNRTRIERLRSIRRHDEDRLNESKIVVNNYTNSMFHHEICDDYIRNVFNGNCEISVKNREDCDYREKQIKFCYALLNLKEFEKLQEFCQRIANYSSLERFEIDFITDLVISLRTNREFIDFLYKTFHLFYKKQLIEYCTRLLMLDEFVANPHEYEIYQILCSNTNPKIRVDFANLLSQLYVYSYCNENLLKLRELLL